MSVQVVDVKTGKLKSMSEKYAQILVKMKRARWPEEVVRPVPAEVVQHQGELPPPPSVVELESQTADAPKKRGRKPKDQE